MHLQCLFLRLYGVRNACNAMYLPEDAIVELTRRKLHKCQARVLAAMGIRFRPRPDGSLAVAQAEVDAALLTRQEKKDGVTSPNLAALG